MNNLPGIQELEFADVIGDRFGRYSKYIIQDRALPDIRDGLKPVQRRILFAMYQERNTADNPYRKSAKTVGNVIGNYHPHGDTSVYDAMVRMSQDWKLREPLIDMHGNNGSMDGDMAAAMRYTEARMSKYANELLRDIDSETIDYALNFDDTLEEPLVLPSRVPNLLINGSTGISSGYATEIPPHNLGEVIDAVIYMLSHKTYTLDTLMKFIQAPDFPTGGIIQGADGIRKAYSNGQGKILVRAKTHVEKLKGNKSQIVATELPYEVNKAKLIQKMDDVRILKKIEGIDDVRDESDRTGLRVVIELKRDVNSDSVLNYLLVNTDLQVNYHLNMVAIHDSHPKIVNLQQILEAYVSHQQDVITRRTNFNLAADQKRQHIVDGLIRVVSILDEVIATIRASENKADAKRNLVTTYEFSDTQAESIVNLQLYRLTNTDVVSLQNERLELNERIHMYRNILSNKETLNKVLINELKDVKKRLQTPRKSLVEAEIQEISVETTLLIPEEKVYVSVTKEGYLKRTSLRSFSASDSLDLGSRDHDYPLFVQELSTHDAIILVTNKGNYIHLPVHEMPDIRWKEIGIHLSQNYQLASGEQIISVFSSIKGGVQTQSATQTQDESDNIVLITRNGRIKQTSLSLFTTYRSYKSRTAVAMTMKDADDELLAAIRAKQGSEYQVVLLTAKSYSLRYDLEEVSQTGLKTQGVISINLKDDDNVAAGMLFDQSMNRPQALVLTQRGHLKRFDIDIINQAGRGSRGILLLKELKTNPHRILTSIPLSHGSIPVVLYGDTGYVYEFNTTDIPLTERLANGSAISEIDQLGKVLTMHPARLKMLDDN
ncbi:DNA topoisomerase IV subunit A [Fundicoccus sp. Sow4_D5]|uniref:DNA topoisomerase IV subunit A n=1 Tax=Fundicoccus sp. Sow4_D5 TaxID=3438782 RepID=UPI003F8F5D80